MNMLFRQDRVWNAANWVTRAFFDDALQFLREGSALASKIQRCRAIEIDTLDMRDADAETLRDLSDVIEKVIAWNEQMRGKNFHDATMFPAYVKQLGALRELVHTISA